MLPDFFQLFINRLVGSFLNDVFHFHFLLFFCAIFSNNSLVYARKILAEERDTTSSIPAMTDPHLDLGDALDSSLQLGSQQ